MNQDICAYDIRCELRMKRFDRRTKIADILARGIKYTRCLLNVCTKMRQKLHRLADERSRHLVLK